MLYKKLILSFSIILFVAAPKSQAQYFTPWYGYLGFQTNSTVYSDGANTIKAPLTYVDTRAVYARDKFYGEWGMPVVSYFLTKIISTGNLNADQGEVSYLYAKVGRDIYRSKVGNIGLGGSFDLRGVSTAGIPGYGASLESYVTLNPMAYAKLHFGKINITPIFEYNALSYSNAEATRPGWSFTANIVLPISKNLGINVSPIIEKGKYKGLTEMASRNVALKIGIVKIK